MGSPIQLQTTFPAGTVLSADQGFTIQWTGGDPDDLVRVQLISQNGLVSRFNTYWTTVSAGSLTLSGSCDIGPTGIEGTCLWPGLASSGDAELVIDVLPPGAIAATSGTTQIFRDYRYTFNSLVLGP